MNNLRFYIITFLLVFIPEIYSQNTSDEHKNRLLQDVKPSNILENPYQIQTLKPEFEVNKYMLPQKLRQDNNNLNLNLQDKIDLYDISSLTETFPMSYDDPYTLKNLFPQVKMDVRFLGGYESNRYNDPYFRPPGFSPLFWERDSPAKIGFVIGGLNLHDPKSWFTRKKRQRIARNIYKITQWVYPID